MEVKRMVNNVKKAELITLRLETPQYPLCFNLNFERMVIPKLIFKFEKSFVV